jgi:hypothetical protein
LLLHTIERVKTHAIFDRDSYKSRREALPGSPLLKVLVFYHLQSMGKIRCHMSQHQLRRALQLLQDIPLFIILRRGGGCDD